MRRRPRGWGISVSRRTGEIQQSAINGCLAWRTCKRTRQSRAMVTAATGPRRFHPAGPPPRRKGPAGPTLRASSSAMSTLTMDTGQHLGRQETWWSLSRPARPSSRSATFLSTRTERFMPAPCGHVALRSARRACRARIGTIPPTRSSCRGAAEPDHADDGLGIPRPGHLGMFHNSAARRHHFRGRSGDDDTAIARPSWELSRRPLALVPLPPFANRFKCTRCQSLGVLDNAIGMAT